MLVRNSRKILTDLLLENLPKGYIFSVRNNIEGAP